MPSPVIPMLFVGFVLALYAGLGLLIIFICALISERKHRHLRRDVRAAVALLRYDPTGWRRDDYTLFHRDTGIKLWVSNGRRYVGFYDPPKVEVGTLSRWQLWYHIKRLPKPTAGVAEKVDAWIAREAQTRPEVVVRLKRRA